MFTASTSMSRETDSISLKVQLYDAKTIDLLDWPETEDGEYAKKFLTPLVKHGITHYIHNIQAEIYVLKVGHLIMPVVVVNENYVNSWVCSPYAHYFLYGRQYAKIIGNSFLANLAKGFLSLFAKLGRISRVNSVVYVNNWMFSTDLYPEGIDEECIELIIQLLTLRFPRYAIVFRSLNSITTPTLIPLLKNKKFHLIASRYVFVTDPNNQAIFETRIVKSDLRLWQNNPYQLLNGQEITEAEQQQALELYQKLYIEKHSSLQPQYTLPYFKHLIEKQLLQFRFLKLEDEIKGVAAFYTRAKVLMCPVFGYEKESANSNTIYRLLNVILLKEAQKKRVWFNESAGASFFKSLRHAEGCLEYIAVYTDHLPLQQRSFWRILELVMNKIGARYMNNY